MKKLGVSLFALFMAAAVSAQDGSKALAPAQYDELGNKSLPSRLAEKNIFNHLDVGVNVGTLGIGVDVAVPVGDYVRIRTGYNYMPRFTIHSNFNIETSTGGSITNYINKINNIDIDKKMEELKIDIDQPEFKVYKDAFNQFRDLEPKDYVTMGMRPNLHQFKFLVDILPFKNNKHWNFTAGFFVGPSTVGDACNMEKETKLLQAINTYNLFYIDYLSNGRNFAGHGEVGKLTEIFTENGVAGFPLGKFSDGDIAMMVPNEDATARAEMEVSKVRPYIGLGYNTHLSRDRKWNLNVDAGIMFLCGKPSVYVDNVYKIDVSPLKGDFDENWIYQYESGMGFNPDGDYYGDIVRPNANYDYENPDAQPLFIVDKPLSHVDLVHDLHDINGKVGNMVNTISKFKVYPNVSVTVSYRIF